MTRLPSRGEIWFAKLPTDPSDKPPRPVIIVSLDARNHHPRAATVLVAPLSGAVERNAETHLLLAPGETGLHPSKVRAEDVTVVRKESLIEPKTPLRVLSHTRICQIADAVRVAMGCPVK
ncbi:MAG TPA: type II toxin-antitoxin system PemK/MazF family toxin [Terriglobales bacterium]|nr:type II toxin-antitoxin system PemK/MazF family toxin [Terriglobales bacterium]